MPKKGSTAVKVTFMTMTLVTPVTAVKFDYGAVLYSGLSKILETQKTKGELNCSPSERIIFKRNFTGKIPNLFYFNGGRSDFKNRAAGVSKHIQL